MSEKVEIVAELKDLISGKFADINKQIDAMDSKLSKVGSSGGSTGGGSIMGQVLGANLLTGAISRAGSAIYDFGKDSIQAYGKSEKFLVSLTTMFKGNKEEAKALDQQLKGFAIETPFELNEIRDATRMMIAYGSTSGGVVNEMRMLGDISSGVGSSLSEVAYLYGTLRTQGRAFSKDIYQFTGRGIPIVKELAKQFHVTDSAVMKLVEDGKVGFKEVEKAMQAMTGEGGQFHDMMNAQSKTLLGQISNLDDAWDQLKTAIGASQEGILKATVSWATEMVSSIKKVVEASNFKKDAYGGLPDFIKKPLNDERDNEYLAYSTALGPDGKRSVKKFKTDEERDSFLGRMNAGLDAKGKELEWNRGVTRDTKDMAEIFANDMFSKMTSATPQNAQERLNEAIDLQRQIKFKTRDNEMSPGLAANELSVIATVSKTYNELLRSSKAEKDKDKSEKEPSKLEEIAKKNKATQIIVNIENLVRELTNVNQQASSLNQLTTEGTLKALTVAVNNIYATGQ